MDRSMFTVSTPNSSVLNNTVGTSITFNTRYPFAKLDSTNVVSFQNISLTFLADVPGPTGSTLSFVRSTVYTFAHGYKYIPTCWMMFQRTVGSGVQSDVTSTRISSYGYQDSTICVANATDGAPNAVLSMSVDSTNVYITVVKSGSPAVSIAGYTLLIRVYVFVNDQLGMDVPTKA